MTKNNKFFRLLGLIIPLYLNFPGAAAADSATKETEESTNGIIKKTGDTVERYHGAFTRKYIDTVEWMDSYYGDSSYAEETNRSWARLRLDTVFKEEESAELKARLKAKVIFPQTEGKIQFLFSGDDDDSFDQDDDDGSAFGSGGFSDEDNAAAALRYVKVHSPNFISRYDLGLHSRDSTYRLNVSAKQSYHWGIGEHWNGHISNRLWLFTSIGWEDDIKFEFDRLFGERQNWLFRSFSKLRWREIEDYSTFEQRFSFYNKLRGNSLIAYEGLAYYQTEPDEETGEKLESTELRIREF